MEAAVTSDITLLLREWSGGDRLALNRLVPIVHGELERIAGRNLRRRGANDTLTPAALVKEIAPQMVLRFYEQQVRRPPATAPTESAAVVTPRCVKAARSFSSARSTRIRAAFSLRPSFAPTSAKGRFSK